METFKFYLFWYIVGYLCWFTIGLIYASVSSYRYNKRNKL